MRGFGLLVVFLVSLLMTCVSGVASEAPEVNAFFSRSEWMAFLSRSSPQDLGREELQKHAEWIENNYQRFHQYDGIQYLALRSTPKTAPTSYLPSDTALYTGFYLATAVFRFQTTREVRDLKPVLETLRGVYLLSHGTGIPGQVARFSIPWNSASQWNFPERYRPYVLKKQEVWLNVSKKTSGFLGSFFASKAPAAPPLSHPPTPNEQQWREALIEKPQLFLGPDHLPDPFHGSSLLKHPAFFPQTLNYLLVTRDQMTGVLLGLSAVLRHLTPQESDSDLVKKEILRGRRVAQITGWAIYKHLRRNGYSFRDPNGEIYTSSHSARGLLKYNLLLLAREISIESGKEDKVKAPWVGARERIEKEIGRLFSEQMWSCTAGWAGVNPYLAKNFNYYKWNLDIARLFSIVLLEKNKDRLAGHHYYFNKCLWPAVRNHENTVFIFLKYAMGFSDPERSLNMEKGMQNLRSLALRPLRSFSSPLAGAQKAEPGFVQTVFNDETAIVPPHLRRWEACFVWAKDPFHFAKRPGLPIDEWGLTEASGGDYLFAYWLGRYYFPQWLKP